MAAKGGFGWNVTFPDDYVPSSVSLLPRFMRRALSFSAFYALPKNVSHRDVFTRLDGGHGRRHTPIRKPKRKDTLMGVFLFGADDGARTRYLHLGKVALYQMSYIRILLVPPDGIEPSTRGFSVPCSTN